jgi:hypothetical protein
VLPSKEGDYFFAAADLGTPVSILSFLASEKGVSSREQVAEAIETLKKDDWR